MTKVEVMAVWTDGASRDKKMAQDAYKTKHFDWSLFFWQLVLEKTLKAVLVSREKEIIWTHNLVLLAKKSDIVLTEEEKKELNEITTFNIEARYENIKSEFYLKANKKFADKWVLICDKFYKKFSLEVGNE